MIGDVVEKLKQIGLGVGPEKSHWTSTPPREQEVICMEEGQIVWEDSLTFVGTVLDLTGNAGPAMVYCMAQADTAFAKWKDILTCPWIPKTQRIMLLPKKVWMSLL